RFELSSLDVRRAAEAAIDRKSILAPKADGSQTGEANPLRALQECAAPPPAGPGGEVAASCKQLLSTKGEDLTCRLTVQQLQELVSKSALRPAALARKTY